MIPNLHKRDKVTNVRKYILYLLTRCITNNMQIHRPAGIIVVLALVVSIAPNQLIRNVVATNGPTTARTASSLSSNGGNITLGSPVFSYTEYDKTTSFRPAIINGTHGILISFTGHGILDEAKYLNITDNGTAFVTNSTGGAIYTTGRGEIVSSIGSTPETVAFSFQGIGYYGTDGKLRDTGTVLNTKANGILVSGTLSGELRNAVGIYKDEIDKAGNAITKIWYWK